MTNEFTKYIMFLRRHRIAVLMCFKLQVQKVFRKKKYRLKLQNNKKISRVFSRMIFGLDIELGLWHSLNFKFDYN